MKWYWYIGILLLLYWIWQYYKTIKQMAKLQKLAQAYPVDFRLFVEKEEGWDVYDSNHTGKGCIKLIPDPQIGSKYYYYIKFTGPISEQEAIKYLIRNFLHYMNDIGRL